MPEKVRRCAPCSNASLKVWPSIVRVAGTSYTLVGVVRPCSISAEAVSIFSVEPGSTFCEIARGVMSAASSIVAAPGSIVEESARAKMEPSRTSITMAVHHSAFSSSARARTTCCAKYCTSRLMVRRIFLPSTARRCSSFATGIRTPSALIS